MDTIKAGQVWETKYRTDYRHGAPRRITVMSDAHDALGRGRVAVKGDTRIYRILATTIIDRYRLVSED